METMDFFEKDTSCRGRISIEKKFIPDVWVEMDQGHLRQIMLNLLKNASEAIQEKGTISVEIEKTKDSHAIVTIRDNGCGIPAQHMSHIFDPFFTTRPEGTGLGLSIVQRILAGYDARLDVDSDVGTGTAFKLRLKQARNPVDASH
jgi:two-component system sensor histidine kinase PilS (NtrC family)